MLFYIFDTLRLFYLQEDVFCDEFHLVDLRLFENCKKVCEGVEHVFNLAADMGGMGFIQSNHSVILYNNTMVSYNMLEAARQCGVKRYGGLPPLTDWLVTSAASVAHPCMCLLQDVLCFKCLYLPRVQAVGR